MRQNQGQHPEGKPSQALSHKDEQEHQGNACYNFRIDHRKVGDIHHHAADPFVADPIEPNGRNRAKYGRYRGRNNPQ